ncbi:hypothetical protein ABMA27_014933 [Loxostege sticticalis]|uniref:Nucleolar protein 12 n=1 Tax=Loxostege sticticalis TaxID=481309 RepID=A0ABR3IAQ4_LOXSC
MKKTTNAYFKINIPLLMRDIIFREFLCGFRKRKLERKKKAQEELQRMLKEEKRRIKQENKESYKKLIVSSRPIPDIEQLLQDEYEDEDVNVKIVELSSDTLQKRDLVIGQNKPKETIVKKDTPKKKDKVTQNIPGMGSEEESGEEESEAEDNKDDNMKTKKEIKRMLKKQATKKIQKSKVFQMKSKLDRVKNKKKSQQKKGLQAKMQPRKDKSKKKIGRRKH